MIATFPNRVYLQEIITVTDSYHKKIVSLMDKGELLFSRDKNEKRYVKRDYLNYWLRKNRKINR